MKIAIASDHGGFELKRTIADHLSARGVEVHDLGANGPESTDYPAYALAVVRAILDRRADLGVLICGTGIGMSMVANRFAGIRAAVCSCEFMAGAARRHNDANILALGGRVVGPGLALAIVDAFLAAEFEGGRHARRLAQLAALAGLAGPPPESP